MRLVRGSIIYSKPCPLSRAVDMLEVFLATDAGADVSVKGFLKSAATALKSMREGERSSHRKSKRRKHRHDLENNSSIAAPKDEIDDVEGFGHGKGSKKNHRVKEDGGSVMADMQAKRENLVSDLENTSAEPMNSRKMRAKDEINADIVSPVMRETEREVRGEGEGVTERRKKDRKHASKEQVDLQRELQLERGKKAEMRVKQEKLASDLANTSVEQMTSRHMRDKHDMNADSVSSVLREPKREVSGEVDGVTEKKRKKDGKRSGKEQTNGLERELHLEGGKAVGTHVKREKPVSDLDNAWAERMYLTKLRGENVTSTGIASSVTRELTREVGDEWEGITEKRRKKDRKHSSKEHVEDLQRNFQMEGGKTEFELKGTLGTWKKPRKTAFPNGVVLSGGGEEAVIHTDLGLKVEHWKPSEEENNLVVLSSRKAEKWGVLTDRLEEGTNSHRSKGKRKERAGGIEFGEMEQHSKKKRARSQI